MFLLWDCTLESQAKHDAKLKGKSATKHPELTGVTCKRPQSKDNRTTKAYDFLNAVYRANKAYLAGSLFASDVHPKHDMEGQLVAALSEA